MSSPASPRPSLAQLATRGALWAAGSQYIFFGLGVLKTIILFRLVGAEYYGLMALATVWASYLSLARFDLRLAVYNSREEPVILDAQFWIENVSAVACLILAGVLALILPGSIITTAAWPVIFILLLLGLFETLTSTQLYLTEKRLRQDVLGRLTIFTSLIGLILPVGLALSGNPLPALIMDAILPSLVTGAGVSLFVRWRPTLIWDRQQIREQLKLGWTLLSSGWLGKIIFQFDDWLVGTLNRPNPIAWLEAGIRAEGYYSRAYNAGKMPMDVAAGMIGRIALSLYAESAARGHETLTTVYRQLTWLLSWVILASSVFAFVTADELVGLLVGVEWLPITPLFRLMFLFVVGRPFLQNIGQLLLALRAEQDYRRVMALQSAFMLVAAPPAVYFWGAAGASVVASVMTIIGWIIAERYVVRRLQARIWRVYLTPAITGVTIIIGVTLLQSFWPGSAWLSLILKSGLTFAGFALALVIFERQTALTVWRRLRHGLSKPQ